MRKTRKWPSLFIATLTLLSLSACQEWGEMDPPAGNQVYPKLEQVAHYTFEDGEYDPVTVNYYAYPDGEPATVEDTEDPTYGKALHLNNGYARIFNPLAEVKAQNGVSLTFMMKQALLTDPETEEPLENDLTGAIFSFQNTNGTQRMFLTANGWLVYDTMDGEYEANNPANEPKTDMLPNDGQWHYVALKVRNDGYEVYVNGKKKVEKTETRFDFAKIVQFMASTPYIYIAYGADTPTREMWIDNLKIYRNQITDAQIKDPRKPASEEEEFAYPIATKQNIGASDCTSGWWTEFSDYYTLQPATTLRLSFTNHTSGLENWNNWNICLATQAERGAADYAEYFVLRSDLYGWGNTDFDLANIKSEGYTDWAKFKTDMEGAKVTIDVTRTAARVDLTATAIANDGTTYTETYHQECGDGTQNINAFLIVDNSYLEMNTAETCYTDAISITQPTVGTSDCTAGWWSAFSQYFTIPAGGNFEVSFINHTSGLENWNNWNCCLTTNAERGAAEYAEYFLLRSDLYGWGNTDFNLANIKSEGYTDWAKFKTDMEGAKVTIRIERSGPRVDFTATAIANDGTRYVETYHQECGDGTQPINAFLIVDGSYLEVQAASNITKAFR